MGYFIVQAHLTVHIGVMFFLVCIQNNKISNLYV